MKLTSGVVINGLSSKIICFSSWATLRKLSRTPTAYGLNLLLSWVLLGLLSLLLNLLI